MADLSLTIYPDELCSLLECAECKEVFTDPVSLGCNHLFCRKCLPTTFKNSFPESNENAEWCLLKCPICGKGELTNLSLLISLPGNMQLQRIVELLCGITDRCRVHRKPLVLFCFVCEDGKCLTCFIKICAKKSHSSPKDLVVMATQVRSDAQEKLRKVTEELNVSLEERNEKKMLLLAALRRQLPTDAAFLLEKADNYIVTTTAREMERLKAAHARLTTALNQTTNAELVKANREFSDASVLQSEMMLSSLASISEGLDEVIDGSIVQLKQTLSGYDISTEQPNLSTAALGQCMKQLADSDESEDVDWSSSSVSPATSTAPKGVGRIIEPIFQTSFAGIFVNSISYISGLRKKYFLLNTADGSIEVNSQNAPERHFRERRVKAVCAISPTKILALIRNNLFVYEIQSLTEQRLPIFNIPNKKLNSAREFDCIGVTSPETFYVVSETRTKTIQVWDAKARKWQQSIDIMAFADKYYSQLSFKICAFKSHIYLSIYHLSQVRSLTVDGTTKWSNRRVCRRPNGIVADKNWVYVCEGETSLSSVVILNPQNGHRHLVIRTPLMKRPYTLAVGNGQMAVVERYYRHNLNISPIKLFIFDVVELLGVETDVAGVPVISVDL